MDMQIRFRNNDLGPYMPTQQERMNSIMSSGQTASSAAEELQPPVDTPHMLNNAELQATLQQLEAQAQLQNAEFLQAHSGLNEQRVARLLGLLD